MTRRELREAVRQCWQDSSKSWVMAGLAFARLAPHILEELDTPDVPPSTVLDEDMTLLDHKVGRHVD